MANHTITQAYFQITNIVVADSCAACGKSINKNQGTAGPYNAKGELTLICYEHLQSSRQFINLLADFISVQKQRYMQSKDTQQIKTKGVKPDAWFLY